MNIKRLALLGALAAALGIVGLALITSPEGLAQSIGHSPPAGQTVEGSRVCIPVSSCSGATTEHKHCVSKNRRGHFISKSLAKKNGHVRDKVTTGHLGSNCHHLSFNLDGHQAVTDYTDGSPTKYSANSDHKRDGRSASNIHENMEYGSRVGVDCTPIGCVSGSRLAYCCTSHGKQIWESLGCDKAKDGDVAGTGIKKANGDWIYKRDPDGAFGGCADLVVHVERRPFGHRGVIWKNGRHNGIDVYGRFSCHRRRC